jgi:NAD-specific glutamate dehydrogenase
MIDGSADRKSITGSDDQMVALLDELGGQEEFAAALFGGVAPEDLARYQPSELAALAASAWVFLSRRTAGEPKIRISDPQLPRRDGGKPISSLRSSTTTCRFSLTRCWPRSPNVRSTSFWWRTPSSM